MNKKAISILQFIGSVTIILVFYFFYFRVIKWLGISINVKNVLICIEYLLMSICIYFIYRSSIHSSRNKFSKTMLNSLIITIACFVFLIFVSILVNKISYSLFKLKIPYPFVNYLDKKITLSNVLNIITNCLFKPYLLCMIFVFGIANIIRKSWTSAFVSGISYAIFYGYMLHTSFKVAFLASLIPGIVFMLLTYLYKTNKNIYSIIIIYIAYVLFGSILINYIM